MISYHLVMPKKAKRGPPNSGFSNDSEAHDPAANRLMHLLYIRDAVCGGWHVPSDVLHRVRSTVTGRES